MREIKFRAFHKISKQMVDGFDLIHCQSLKSEVNGRDQLLITMKGQTVLYNCNADYNANTDEFILMQFTGLKDKNGKEIYEGDVVEWSNKKYLVKWHEKIAGFVMEFNGIERPDIELESEIIGNIYEQEHLLK